MNNNGNAVISVLVIGVILNLIIASFMISSRDTTSKSQTRRYKSNLVNIAEAGKEHLYGQIQGGAFKPVKITGLFTAPINHLKMVVFRFHAALIHLLILYG